MYEFDVRVTVTSPGKGKLLPREKTVEIKSATNVLDCMSQVRKKLHGKQERIHFVLDVECFKRNIRKERVRVTNEELEKYQDEFIRVRPLEDLKLFERKDTCWDF